MAETRLCPDGGRRRQRESRQWRRIDGEDVCRQQETAAAADKKLQGRQLPTRDNGNKRHR
jgi:hypothetical protein